MITNALTVPLTTCVPWNSALLRLASGWCVRGQYAGLFLHGIGFARQSGFSRFRRSR